MTQTSQPYPSQPNDPSQLPFVAPCRKLKINAPLNWLTLGYNDFKQAPVQSCVYGLVIMIAVYSFSWMAYSAGSFIFMIALLAGYMFIGPLLAFGLYSISQQIHSNKKPVLGYCLRQGRRHFGNEMIFAAILLVVFLVWARAASTVHIFFPAEVQPDYADLIVFLGVGSLIGLVFSTIIFCASAFSLPMLMDKKVDVVTALITSINATLRNKAPMALWAILIVVILIAGFFTASLFILLPIVGHATWHAYVQTINAEAWPDHFPDK